MDTYGDNLGERYAAEVITQYFDAALEDKITNQDYEKVLSAGGASLIKVKTFGALTIQTYTRGTPLTPDDPSESEATFDPDQEKAIYFELDSLDVFEDYVKDPASALYKRAVGQLVETVNTYIQSLYADAGSGNRVGVSHTTGTVEVTVTTGEVTGSGTGWTAGTAWQGLGFKATGHTKWYRIVAHATHAISATSLYIENDSDDDDTSYDGGAITAGTAYEIEATAVKTVTVDNIFDTVDEGATNLDENKIPAGERWIVLPAKIASVARRSEEMQLPVAAAYEEVIKRGLLGDMAGFTVYKNQQVSGNNSTGYYCLYGHKSAITFAMEFKESKIEGDITGEFGKRHKALWVYGAKIIDERRKALGYLWVKV